MRYIVYVPADGSNEVDEILLIVPRCDDITAIVPSLPPRKANDRVRWPWEQVREVHCEVRRR
jgi:hypothetical protein